MSETSYTSDSHKDSSSYYSVQSSTYSNSETSGITPDNRDLYGMIIINSYKCQANNEIVIQCPVYYTYKPKNSSDIKMKDIFNVALLNVKLYECDEYVIAGLYGSKIGILFTNKCSVYISCRYKMCNNCKLKWNKQFYDNSEICDCQVENKKDCRIMYIMKGEKDMTHDYIDIMKLIVSQRANMNLPQQIYLRKKSDIRKDLVWCEEIYKSMRTLTEKKISLKHYKNMLHQLRTENDILKEKNVNEMDVTNLIKQRYTSVLNKLEETVINLNAHNEIITSLQNEIDRLNQMHTINLNAPQKNNIFNYIPRKIMKMYRKIKKL